MFAGQNNGQRRMQWFSKIIFSNKNEKFVNFATELQKILYGTRFENGVFRTRCVVNLAALGLTISHLVQKTTAFRN